jgi:hypothetical protein
MNAPALSICGIPKLNPATGLSTDYLNHFNEAVMLLEMLPAMPECIDDLLAWEPKSYSEHFAASSFSDRDTVIAAYEAADPAIRGSVDMLAEIMNTMLAATREAIAANADTPKAHALATRTVNGLKPLIARTSAAINGTAPALAGMKDQQGAVDAMFRR